MEITTVEHPAKTTKTGSQIVTVPYGKSLKIETTPGGEEVLDAAVPEGKVWTARISVDIVETVAE